jgi:hypothetical protein
MKEFKVDMTSNERWKGMVMLHLGGKNTGKSTFTAQALKKWQARNKGIVIYDRIGHKYWKNVPLLTLEQLKTWNNKGIVRVDDPDVYAFCQIIFDYVRNVLIVFDDCTPYFKGSLPKIVEDMLLQSRNYCNDFFLNAHSLRQIAPVVLLNADVVILRDTYENPKSLPAEKCNAELMGKYLTDIQRENKIKYPATSGKKVPQLAYRVIDPLLPYE